MPTNSAIDLLVQIAESGHLKVEKLKFKKLPATVKTTLAKWLRVSKIPETALKKKIMEVSHGKKGRQFYVAAYALAKPKSRKGAVIVQGGTILGESSNQPNSQKLNRASAKRRPSPKPQSTPVMASPSPSSAGR